MRFDGTGRSLLSLYRKGAPVLYDVLTDDVVASFAHPKYRNFCTMKSACFAGDKDQVLLFIHLFIFILKKVYEISSRNAMVLSTTHFNIWQ